MTENEAKQWLKHTRAYQHKCDNCEYIDIKGACNEECKDFYDMAIQALEEIQQYRAIGTVEEFKALKENQFFNFDSPVVRIDKKSYDKAIDDFAEKIFYYCSMSNMNATMIRQIAEQLKGEKQ